jgi:hypothetical protein
MKIYKDPLGGKALMGYKGQSLMDSGYFFAPYIPLLGTPTVLSPDDYDVPEDPPAWTKDRKPSYRSIDDPWEPPPDSTSDA